MRLPTDNDGGDEKACAQLRSQNDGAPSSIASKKPVVTRALRMCITVPPSLVLRRPREEGTTHLDDEEGQLQLRVKHDELLDSFLILLLLSARKEGSDSLATSEGPTTQRCLLIFG